MLWSREEVISQYGNLSKSVLVSLCPSVTHTTEASTHYKRIKSLTHFIKKCCSSLLPHYGYITYSPVCVRMCSVKIDLRENADPHISQNIYFFPVCIRMCLLKLELSEKAESHISQENGLSPVCIRMCFFKLEFSKNADPHI